MILDLRRVNSGVKVEYKWLIGLHYTYIYDIYDKYMVGHRSANHLLQIVFRYHAVCIALMTILLILLILWVKQFVF